jgi:Na+/melibiose symporter-like transporter
MRNKIFAVIFVGMTIGFLLALGLVAILRSLIEGKDVGLSVAFTAFIVFLAGVLLYYVTNTTRER